MADALDTLLEAMAGLLEQQAETPNVRPAGEGNFRCQRCEGCSDCRFCSDCTDCVECTYCDGCVACSGCTQSKHCRDCERISHSQLSRACDDCSYVTLCVGCEQCVHCFGCVALSGGEFCILNEKVGRKEYQARIAEIRIALERRLSTGWRPSWLGDDDGAAIDDAPLGADDRGEPEDDAVEVERGDAPISRPEEITVRRPAPMAEPVAPAVLAPPVPTPAPVLATPAPVEAPPEAPRGPSVLRGRPPRPGEATPSTPAASSSIVAARRPPRRP